MVKIFSFEQLLFLNKTCLYVVSRIRGQAAHAGPPRLVSSSAGKRREKGVCPLTLLCYFQSSIMIGKQRLSFVLSQVVKIPFMVCTKALDLQCRCFSYLVNYKECTHVSYYGNCTFATLMRGQAPALPAGLCLSSCLGKTAANP